jgi:hypothetical protein
VVQSNLKKEMRPRRMEDGEKEEEEGERRGKRKRKKWRTTTNF